MPQAAVPVIAAIIGGGASIVASERARSGQIKAAKAAREGRYALDPEARANMIRQLMGSLAGGNQGQRSSSLGADNDKIKQYVDSIYRKYGQPSAAYQGYLSSLQERRDARSGVPAVPPQGGASPSAQRKQPYQSARTY